MSTRRSGRRTERDDDENEEVVRHTRRQRNPRDDETSSQRSRRKQDLSDNNDDSPKKGNIEENVRLENAFQKEEKSNEIVKENEEPVRRPRQRKKYSDDEDIQVSDQNKSNNNKMDQEVAHIKKLDDSKPSRQRAHRNEDNISDTENIKNARRSRNRNELTLNEEEVSSRLRSQQDNNNNNLTNPNKIGPEGASSKIGPEGASSKIGPEGTSSKIGPEGDSSQREQKAKQSTNKVENKSEKQRKESTEKETNEKNAVDNTKRLVTNKKELSESEDSIRTVNRRKQDNTEEEKTIEENTNILKTENIFKTSNVSQLADKTKLSKVKQETKLDLDSLNNISSSPKNQDRTLEIIKSKVNKNEKSDSKDIFEKKLTDNANVVQNSLNQEKFNSDIESEKVINKCYDNSDKPNIVETHGNRNIQIPEQQQTIDNFSTGYEKTNEENKQNKLVSDQTNKNLDKFKTNKKELPSVPDKKNKTTNKLAPNKLSPNNIFNNKTKSPVVTKGTEEKQNSSYDVSTLASPQSSLGNSPSNIPSSGIDSKCFTTNGYEIKSENEYTQNQKTAIENNNNVDDVINFKNKESSNAHDIIDKNITNTLENRHEKNNNDINQIKTSKKLEFDYNEAISDLQNGHLVDETINDHEAIDVNLYNNKLRESLTNVQSSSSYSSSQFIDSLMDTYLIQDYLPGASSVKSQGSNKKSGKQPPSVKNKPNIESKNIKEVEQVHTEWPPKEPPQDIGAYIVESYGKTDPYSKKLIKDIQRSKREEEERREAEKRAEVISENTQAVSILRSTFGYKPPTPKAGVQKPTLAVAEENSWIKHEKKPEEFDSTPSEPDWMTLIRNRRWKSTVRARFPGKSSDKTDFERRSTTPKNWKNLAKDKQALQVLSEVVGIGAEGEELLMRLASQRNKIEEKQKEVDKQAQEELLAYEVARERLGSDTAYSLQMDNPLPAARMKLNPSYPAVSTDSVYGSKESLNSNNYPFTNSQLEAAYLTNKLLRLHPEELKKLISLERSRQATLRWQFSADKFDSVHDHQNFPIDIALLASQEPRLMKTMKMLLANENKDEYESDFSTRSNSRNRTQSDCTYMGDSDGYESSSSHTSSVASSRSYKKKAPVPPPKKTGENLGNSHISSHPRRTSQRSSKYQDNNREVLQHGFLTDEELSMSDEIERMQEALQRGERHVYEELRNKSSTPLLGFFDDIAQAQTKPFDLSKEIDQVEIASRRQSFIEKDSRTNIDAPEVIPTTRHKVKRINSNAQLTALFRKRRERSESDCENNSSDHQSDEKPSEEMKNLLNNITNTFGQ